MDVYNLRLLPFRAANQSLANSTGTCHRHPNTGRKLVVNDALKAILRGWSALIRLVGRCPIHVTELFEHLPAYQGFVDASKWGVGGVWFGGTNQLIPIIWFYEWPQ
jgi:hypothetical protein